MNKFGLVCTFLNKRVLFCLFYGGIGMLIGKVNER